MLELGTSFKKARESLNVSIDKIAVETRISTRFLRAIEDEQFELLPGGIFNRGFIRTYADRLGMDPEEAIRSYEKLSRSAEIEPARQETERVSGSTTRIPVYYAAIAGLLVLVVVFYFITTRHVDTPVATAATAKATASTNAPATAPATVPPTATPDAPSESTAVVTPEPTPTPLPEPAKQTPPPPATSSIATAPAAIAASSPIVVDLEVREESWFKLSSDGTAVTAGEVLPVGTTRHYTAKNEITLSIGNAAGVQLRLNGQAVSSLGRSGQVRSVTITPKTTAAALAVPSR